MYPLPYVLEQLLYYRIRSVVLNNKFFFILHIVSKTSLGIPCHAEI